MNEIIKTRVETIFKRVVGKYSVLPDEVVHTAIAKLRSEFMPAPSQTPKKTVNLADLSSDDIKKYLGTLPIDPYSEVLLIWPAYRSGIRMPFHIFVENYDELWHPASDDILLTDQEMNCLLEIDHEENITFYNI